MENVTIIDSYEIIASCDLEVDWCTVVNQISKFHIYLI